MKSDNLTSKQQLKVRARVFRLLAAIGFQYDTKGEYWWRKVPGQDCRVCVGFNVADQCLGGRTDWVWQIAKLNENPAFGYSGSVHVGAKWGTVEKIVDITLERFWTAGFLCGLNSERDKRMSLIKSAKNLFDQAS